MKNTSLMKLTVQKAQYYAYHGVKKEEKKIGGKYEVDVELFYDATEAVINDSVNYALNYEEVMFTISEIIVGEEQYDLIETICNEIANSISEKFAEVKKVTCRVRKFTLPLRRIIEYIEAEQTIEH